MRYHLNKQTMPKSSSFIQNVLHIVSWLIFIGLCIETGGIVFNTIYAIYKPIVATYFWNGLNFSSLYQFDKGNFIVLMVMIIIASVLKTLIFYLIVKLFYDKKLNFEKPFNSALINTVSLIAYICIGIGFFLSWAVGYSGWLKGLGVQMPEIQTLRLGGADVWFFMAVVLFVVVHIFKKGVELQNETDLTI